MSEDLKKQVQALEQRSKYLVPEDRKKVETAIKQIDQAIEEHKKALYSKVKQIIQDM